MSPDESRLGFFLALENWSLFYHTARNMQVGQVAGVAERKARHLVIPSLPVDFDTRYERQLPDDPVASPAPVQANTATLRDSLSPARKQAFRERMDDLRAGELTFCNDRIAVESPDGCPDWFHPEVQRRPQVWRLKFRGFTFLRWPVLAADGPTAVPEVNRKCQEWLRYWWESPATDIGREKYLRRGWTPHAVSLRLLHCCRYYGWCVEQAPPEVLELLSRLICKNALFLANHVEHEVGGNHLVENSAALAAAGTLFETGNDWLETGCAILADASDQFLADGGHFERSPMYHVQVLTRYLTVLDLLQQAGKNQPAALKRAAREATAFLQDIRPPDGQIPLLNDSVFDEAMALDSCLRYARAVGIETPAERREQLPDTGYYWLGGGENRLLVDGGAFGPPHLPAHSHNDLFSVLLWVDGTRLLTDTGTYEYAPTDRRQQARSVRGHNTAQVGDAEPIDIGGRYLAGRRLTPDVEFRHEGERTIFEGRYEKHTRPEYSHERKITAGDGWWLIRDTVTAPTDRPVHSRLHCDPQVTVCRESDDRFTLAVDGEVLAYIQPVGFQEVIETTTPYFPEFGREQHRPALDLTAAANEMTELLLSTEPAAKDAVSRHEVSALDS